jgi:uncharacterized protein (DUF302 family)
MASMNDNGLITKTSNHSVKETINRLDADIKAKGITVFARIDHAAGAASVHMPLRPTELIIFGAPQAGTPLMQSAQTIGIDLPLKMLGWQDALGTVWLSYNDIGWLARRHGIEAVPAIDALAKVLSTLADAAIA